jgi:hypothetical protein
MRTIGTLIAILFMLPAADAGPFRNRTRIAVSTDSCATPPAACATQAPPPVVVPPAPIPVPVAPTQSCAPATIAVTAGACGASSCGTTRVRTRISVRTR